MLSYNDFITIQIFSVYNTFTRLSSTDKRHGRALPPDNQNGLHHARVTALDATPTDRSLCAKEHYQAGRQNSSRRIGLRDNSPDAWQDISFSTAWIDGTRPRHYSEKFNSLTSTHLGNGPWLGQVHRRTYLAQRRQPRLRTTLCTPRVTFNPASKDHSPCSSAVRRTSNWSMATKRSNSPYNNSSWPWSCTMIHSTMTTYKPCNQSTTIWLQNQIGLLFLRLGRKGE